MADTKLTELTELDGAGQPAADDWLYIVDKSDTTDDAAGSSRKIDTGRFVRDTGGSGSVVTGGGTIATAGFTATVPATGTLVTTAATQTLTNKTLTTPTLTLKQSADPTPTAEGAIEWETDTNQIHVGDGSGTKVFSDDSVTAVHGATGAVVGTTNTQTLTNKTLTSPDINGGTVDAITSLTGHNGTGGFKFGTVSLTDGTAATIIANGTGDVTEALLLRAMISPSGASATQCVLPPLEPSSSTTLFYSSGSDEVTWAVAADGSSTLQRTGGTKTYNIAYWALWV